MRRAKERCGTASGIEGLFSGKTVRAQTFQFQPGLRIYRADGFRCITLAGRLCYNADRNRLFLEGS